MEKVAEIISEELFRSMVNRLEQRLSYGVSLKLELRYNEKDLNKSLKSDFDAITEVLQSVVDSQYTGYYEVSGFEYLTVDNLDFSIGHNLNLLKNCNKLLKFIK